MLSAFFDDDDDDGGGGGGGGGGVYQVKEKLFTAITKVI